MQESSVHALMIKKERKKESTTTLEHFCLVQGSFLKVLYKCFQKIEVLFIQWARGLPCRVHTSIYSESIGASIHSTHPHAL